MLFQTLDNKTGCIALYVDGRITKDYNSSELTGTWAPSAHFQKQNIEYANIWAQGEPLDTCCPNELKEEWQMVNKKAMAFLNSFHKSKINLQEVCFYDLLPNNFLLYFHKLKNTITKHIFDTRSRPENHDFMFDLILLLKKIESQNLSLNFKNLDMASDKIRKILPKIKDTSCIISYNPWGTITGRLTTNKNSFPILTLNKELRPALQPKNSYFLELDYNAAEIRVLFSLLGQTQPSGDIHNWIAENIFDNKHDRAQSKKKVFAWLYNPKAKNKKLNSYLNRDALYDKYYKDGYVETPFGRKIKVSEDKAVNYLIQSTTSDLFLTSAIKVDKMLENKKSNICFCVHDSLVLDYAEEDQSILNEVAQEFSNTKFGFFNTNLSLGKNFGSMRKVR